MDKDKLKEYFEFILREAIQTDYFGLTPEGMRSLKLSTTRQLVIFLQRTKPGRPVTLTLQELTGQEIPNSSGKQYYRSRIKPAINEFKSLGFIITCQHIEVDRFQFSWQHVSLLN